MQSPDSGFLPLLFSRPYRKRSKLLSFMSEYHDPPADQATEGVVEMMPWPERVDSGGKVVFDWAKCRERGGSWKEVANRRENKTVEPECVFRLLVSSLSGK